MEMETNTGKKPIYKKWWFWVIIVVVIAGAFGSAGGKNKTETTTTDTSKDTTDTATVIELVAGEKGDYGKEIVMSEGTDLEEHLIVYYVPGGKYTVKNLGDYRTQINVYEGIAKNAETGYDEYTNTGNIVMLDAGAEDDLEVPDGWFIELHEPDHISLTAK